MGLFLETVLFPGGRESECRAAVKRCSDDREFSIEADECQWHVFEKGPAVLLNDGCCGYEAMGERLSGLVECPVMALHIYDDDFWGYSLWQNGREIDQFFSLGDYFGEGEPPRKPGDAGAVGKCFGVEPGDVERYLIPWDEEMMERGEERFAYDGDEAVIGDCWQMADFMKALGFDYDRLCPPADEWEQVSGPEDGAVREQEQVSGSVPGTKPVVVSAAPLPAEPPVLPNALTDREYILLRAQELGEKYGEIVQMIGSGRYQEAAPLITDAVWTVQDNPVLYLLRAFCWNQTEGVKFGLSRKPDMDRDLTRVLELEPDNVMALRARCPVTGTTARYKRHIQDLTRLMELDVENRDSYQVDRAYRFHWVGDDENARKDLEEVVGRGEFRSVDLIYLCGELGADVG